MPEILEEQHQAERWKAFSVDVSGDRIWSECVFEPIADPSLKPDMRSDRVDGVAVSRATMPAMRVTTFGTSVPEPLYRVTRVSQESTLHVDGRQPVRLAPDELVIISSHMRGVWTTDRTYTTSSMHIDERLFKEYLPEAPNLMGRRLRLPFELGEILRQIMDAGMSMAGTGRFQKDARGLVLSFLQILALMPDVSRSEPADKRNALDLRCHQIKSYIRRNFADPDLSIEAVARYLDITPRYVQMAFVAEGMSPSEYLRRCRLEASSRMLAGSEHTHLSITRIAFDCGFGSSAHFSNEFRRYFGVSPRDYRRNH